MRIPNKDDELNWFWGYVVPIVLFLGAVGSMVMALSREIEGRDYTGWSISVLVFAGIFYALSYRFDVWGRRS